MNARQYGAAIVGATQCVTIFVVCTALLTACGFQLRGAQTADAALNPMRVESTRPGSPLLPPLRRALRNAGVVVADGAGAPPRSVLRIVAEDSDERVIALSAQGRPREVELVYRVAFELVRDGDVHPHELVLTREFAVDERDVLGKAHEADVLRDALLRDMVAALVRYAVTP